MIILYFIIAAFLYAITASLPFWTNKNTQLIIAMIIGMGANACWVLISRSIPQSSIPIFSLYFDTQLTMMYLFIPYFFIQFNLSITQIIGIVFIFIGLILTHIK